MPKKNPDKSQRDVLISSTIRKLRMSTKESLKTMKAFGFSVEDAYVILTGSEFENLLETWLEVKHLAGQHRSSNFSGDNPHVLKAVCEEVCGQMAYALDRRDPKTQHAVVIVRKTKKL